MSTIKDVANKAGISVGSVSRYLNGYSLKKNNQKKVEEAIEELNYLQNQTAKSLKMQKSFSIGVVVDTMSNFYSAQLIATLEQEFDNNNYFLLLTSHESSEAIFEKKVNKLLERAIDALIVVKSERQWRTTNKLKKLKIPVVSVEVPLIDNNIPTIQTNDETSVENVVSRMLENSKKIEFIVPTDTDYVLTKRINGIKDAFRKKKHELAKQQVVYANYGSKDAYEKTRKLVLNGCDAVFVTNYSNAILVVKAIQDCGKVVGKDIMVGCFGYSHLFESMNTPITMIKQPVAEVAKKTAETVLKMLNGSGFDDKEITIKNEILWQ